MFPEGTRSRDGEIGKMRSGAAVIAQQHGIPIVPIYLKGTHDAMPPGRNWPKKRWLFSRRYRIEVHFGPPIWPGIDEHRTDVMARVRTFLESEAGDDHGHRSASVRRPSPSGQFRRSFDPLLGRFIGSAPEGVARKPTAFPRGEVHVCKDDEEADQCAGRRRPRGAAGHGGRPRRPDQGPLRAGDYIVRADAPVQGKVGIISGGGSGHEPMHGGFVGRGMLDAACPGEVFTSPTPDQMLEATKAVDGGAGVLHIVKNYTGDVLNFEMAAELAKGEGIEVEAVVTNDDVAVQDSLYTAGRRGVGDHRARREDLRRGGRGGQVARRGRRALPQGQRPGPHAWAWRSPPCTTPGSGEPSFDLGRRRDGDRHRHPRRAGPLPRAARPGARRSSSGSPPRSSRTCRTSRATRCSRSSTAWAARR